MHTRGQNKGALGANRVGRARRRTYDAICATNARSPPAAIREMRASAVDVVVGTKCLELEKRMYVRTFGLVGWCVTVWLAATT